MVSSIPTKTSTRFIDLDGVRIATRSYGVGQPLVLLNRFRGTMDNWDPHLVTSLARERQVITFDSSGIGESAGKAPLSIETMASVAAGVVRTLALDSPAVLGWSIGGFVAQVLALNEPNLVNKLVLAATTTPSGPADVIWNPDWLETASNPRPTVEVAMSLFYTDTPSSRAAGAASFARMPSPPGAFVSPDAMAAQKQALARYVNDPSDWYARLKEIKAPTFVANGDRDGLFPAVGSALLAREIPGSQLAIYPDSGHGFLFQHAERFSEDVLRFLKDS